MGAYAPPVVLDVTPDLGVIAFISFVSVAVVALFGFIPARHAWQFDISRRIAAGGGRTVSSASASGLVAFQIGLAVLLITSSLLVLKTFWTLTHLNPGFDQEHVIEAVIDPWDAGYTEPEATALLTAISQKVAQILDVRAVSLAGSELMRGIGTKTTVVPAGRHLSTGTFLNTSFNRVTPSYFDSLGIPLLAGRNLDMRDVAVKPARIVVNRAFADYFFPDQNPVGKEIVQGVDGMKSPTAVIVGVVGTAKYRSMREVDPPIYYLASDLEHAGGVIYVRTSGDPAAVIRAMTHIVRELAPTLPLARISTMRRQVEASLWQERLVALLCAFFGCSALLLSGIGVYATLAHSVARRLREFGIRVALGAQKADIMRTLSGRLAIAIASGLAGGLAASAMLLRFIKAFLFQVDPFDVPSFVLASLILLASSLTAAIVPAWHATTIEPAVALRQD